MRRLDDNPAGAVAPGFSNGLTPSNLIVEVGGCNARVWNGGAPLADSLLLLVPSLGWVVAAIAPATRMFSWEPRR
jgi:hypothetical protein